MSKPIAQRYCTSLTDTDFDGPCAEMHWPEITRPKHQRGYKPSSYSLNVVVMMMMMMMISAADGHTLHA